MRRFTCHCSSFLIFCVRLFPILSRTAAQQIDNYFSIPEYLSSWLENCSTCRPSGGLTQMRSLWRLGGLSWLELAKRVWREIQEDKVFGRAAELSYYFLLALFPFLIFLTSIIGLMLGSGTGTRHMLFNYLARIMPPSAFQLIDSTMYEVSAASSGGKLSFGLLAALWAASNGLTAITDSLNTAYDLNEGRPWWKQRLVSIRSEEHTSE